MCKLKCAQTIRGKIWVLGENKDSKSKGKRVVQLPFNFIGEASRWIAFVRQLQLSSIG
jgi:hypothetical protein